MVPDFIRNKRVHKGDDYLTFLENMRRKTENLKDMTISGSDAYIPINYQRSSRIQRTYTVSPRLRSVVEAISFPQLWMVITEDWCGDSAQCLPYIANIAACNSLIDLKIILRDENSDIMQHYLTNGKEAIPKLTAFDADGNELFRWGPRPKAAAVLFSQCLAAGTEKSECLNKLHQWYAKNRGADLENEIMMLM